MVRLRNEVTNVVISVSDEKAARMGTHWVPVKAAAPKPKSTSKKKS